MSTTRIATNVEPARIRGAWQGRISGCLLGKPVEVLSFREGLTGLRLYLQRAGAYPLREYVPFVDNSGVERSDQPSCRDQMVRAEPDDDINYTVLALLLLEEHGRDLNTCNVARAWLRLLPAGSTWTAERAAYKTLLSNMDDEFVNGADAGFDLSACSDNEYNQWIGAQIRADLYGWICPGHPAMAADLARRDAALSHRGDGLHAAAFVAALGAAIPVSDDLYDAIVLALDQVPPESGVTAAVQFGRSLAGTSNAVAELHQKYADMSPVHTLNNLALVVWGLCSAQDDFGVAIGETVAAGWDTDCNGATVGGLIGLTGTPIPEAWTAPWAGRVGVSLAGHSELQLDELVARTVAVAESFDHRKTA